MVGDCLGGVGAIVVAGLDRCCRDGCGTAIIAIIMVWGIVVMGGTIDTIGTIGTTIKAWNKYTITIYWFSMTK